MSLREKSNWIALVASLGVWGFYFARVVAIRPEGGAAFWLFVTCLGLVIAIQLAMLAVVAVKEPRGLESLDDERENLIELKGFRVGYVVLTVLALATAGLALLDVPTMVMANGVILALVLAEAAKSLRELLSYRRGVA